MAPQAPCEQLDQRRDLPDSLGDDEPWYSLWNSLAHQGDVYAASLAAVPHVVEALARDPVRAGNTYFQFPAWVEICRMRHGMTVPEDLAPAYFGAIARLPGLAAVAARAPMDDERLAWTLSAIAAAAGHAGAAEVVLELTDESAERMLAWSQDQ